MLRKHGSVTSSLKQSASWRFGNMLALKTGTGQLDFTGRAASISTGNGRGAIRGTTADLSGVHLALKGIRQPDNHHPLMEQGYMKT